MLIRGFQFGMLLQLSIGPMCLLIFKTSVQQGLLMGLVMAAALTLVDALYIFLAGCGVSAVLSKEKVRRTVRILGCAVLCLFGLNSILSAFERSILPSLQLFSGNTAQNVFLQGIILTASNPLTIVFWGGVFTSEALEKNLSRSQLAVFGAGCILASAAFSSAVAVFGSFADHFLPIFVLRMLNAVVGVVLIFFGLRLLGKK